MSKLFLEEEKQDADFQIVLLERDKKGNPTGKRLSYSSNDGRKIWEFLQKNESTYKKARKNKKRKGKNK